MAEVITGAEVFAAERSRGSYGGFGSSRGMSDGKAVVSADHVVCSAGQPRSFNSGNASSAHLGNRSSNFRSAVHDGRWHSFGNGGGSSRFSGGRSSGNFGGSELLRA